MPRKGTEEFRVSKYGEQQLLLRLIDRGVDLEKRIDEAAVILGAAIEFTEKKDRAAALTLLRKAAALLVITDRETSEETVVINRMANELHAATSAPRKRKHALRLTASHSQMTIRLNARNKLLTMRKRAPQNSHAPDLSKGESSPENPKQ